MNAEEIDLIAIEESVAELQRRIDKLQLDKARALASRAPVRRVPPEILSRVFELGSRSCTHFPSTICGVSRLWNTIAMGTPVVWSNIILGPDWGSGSDAFVRKVHVYLHRSQSSPLLIDLDLSYVDSIDTAHAILTAISPHIERCYSFQVSVPRPEWMELISEHFGGKLAQRMENMSLKFRPSVPWGSAFAPATILEGAMPQLTALTLEGLPLTILRAKLPRLRKLEYRQFEEIYTYPQNTSAATPLADMLALLETSTTLQELRIEHCTFAVDDADLPLDDARPMVRLEHLHTLACAHVDPAYVCLLLESLDAPALRRLVLRWDSMRQVQDVWWFPRAPTAARLFSGVRSLELEGFRLMDGTALVAFLRMLASLPALVSLAITAPYATQSTGQFFDVLSVPTRSGAWVAPRLRDISVAACHGLTGHEVLAFVRARARTARIRRLAISNCPSFDAAVLEPLRNAVDTVLFTLPPALPAVVPPSPMPWAQPVFFS